MATLPRKTVKGSELIEMIINPEYVNKSYKLFSVDTDKLICEITIKGDGDVEFDYIPEDQQDELIILWELDEVAIEDK